jgi:F-type H+-transporting ATPase subunit h
MEIIADMVQDLYLKELKSYKPTPVKPNDAEGYVQKFKQPKTPKSPEEANLVGELKAYEDQTVEVEGQQTEGEATIVEEDWFEDEAEEEHKGH